MLKYLKIAPFSLCKVSIITSKELSTKRCPNVIVLLCTTETVGTKSDENTGSD